MDEGWAVVTGGRAVMEDGRDSGREAPGKPMGGKEGRPAMLAMLAMLSGRLGMGGVGAGGLGPPDKCGEGEQGGGGPELHSLILLTCGLSGGRPSSSRSAGSVFGVGVGTSRPGPFSLRQSGEDRDRDSAAAASASPRTCSSLAVRRKSLI